MKTVHLVLRPRIMLWAGQWVVARDHVDSKSFDSHAGLFLSAWEFCKARNRKEGR